MFGRRTNIIKQVSKKLAPNDRQLKSLFLNLLSDFVEQKNDQRQDNLNLENNLKTNRQNKKHNEIYYRDKLAKSLNGQTEIRVPTGRIDILTSNQIIEVKHIKQWKSALGQIISYGCFYPHHQKRIHLFGVENDNAKILLIIEQCRQHNVNVTFEE
ncbi:MAG: hypothetical protein Tsb0014_41210 [Pleurocapsa sp.]